jgi:exopolyphosphatase/guanosine-5'-triphosphate,3'-diphosphate pyrophosphatase
VLLHRNRYDQDLPDFKITITNAKIQLQFPNEWLNQSPLTRADLTLEADYIKSAGFKLDFA